MRSFTLADAGSQALKVGDTVVGPSTLKALPPLIGRNPQADEDFWVEECRKRGLPLYGIAFVVERRLFGWRYRYYVDLRRLKDGEILRVDLLPPGDSWGSRAPHDPRFEFAKLTELLRFCRSVLAAA